MSTNSFGASLALLSFAVQAFVIYFWKAESLKQFLFFTGKVTNLTCPWLKSPSLLLDSRDCRQMATQCLESKNFVKTVASI